MELCEKVQSRAGSKVGQKPDLQTTCDFELLLTFEVRCHQKRQAIRSGVLVG